MRNFRYISLFIIHLLLCTICFGQRDKIDSLKKALPSLKASARIDCLNALSDEFIKTQTDSAKVYAKQALTEAEKINYVTGQGEAYYNLGNIKWILGRDFPEVEMYASKAVALFDKARNEALLAKSFFLLAFAHYAQSKFFLSIKAYEKAIHLFYKTKDKLNIAYAYAVMSSVEEERGQYEKSLEYRMKSLGIINNDNVGLGLVGLARLYSNAGDYETALEYYRRGGKYAIENKFYSILPILNLLKGETFYLQGEYDSAKNCYNLFIKYTAIPTTDSVEIATLLAKPQSRLGEIFFALGKYDTAQMYLNNALYDFKKANDRNQVMWVLLRLGRNYKEKGGNKAAMQNALELLQIANETGARQYSRDAHFLLYELYKNLKTKSEAYVHLQQYVILKDIIDKDLSAQKLAFYKTKSEREKAEASIKLLNNEKKLQQQQLKQTAQQKNFLIAGIGALLLVGVVLFRNILLKRKNERQKLQHDLELQKLESEKTKVQFQQQTTELEMQALRAQMNPHFIFNSLNSINRFILQNNKAQASEYLTKFSKLVRLILQNSQAALIPLESELEALKLYLELEAVRFNHQFEYKIIVDEDLDTDILKVPPLIIQPYAENAIWHGLMHKEEKGHLEIELFQCDEVLCCKITDDGIGRQKAAEIKSKSASTHKSMGMRITADRIAMLQQNKEIDTTIKITDLVLPDGSAGGTEVLLKIPVML